MWEIDMQFGLDWCGCLMYVAVSDDDGYCGLFLPSFVVLCLFMTVRRRRHVVVAHDDDDVSIRIAQQWPSEEHHGNNFKSSRAVSTDCPHLSFTSASVNCCMINWSVGWPPEERANSFVIVVDGSPMSLPDALNIDCCVGWFPPYEFIYYPLYSSIHQLSSLLRRGWRINTTHRETKSNTPIHTFTNFRGPLVSDSPGLQRSSKGGSSRRKR